MASEHEPPDRENVCSVLIKRREKKGFNGRQFHYIYLQCHRWCYCFTLKVFFLHRCQRIMCGSGQTLLSVEAAQYSVHVNNQLKICIKHEA